MKNLAWLGFKSLVNRKSTVGLVVITIAISCALALAVERVRVNAWTSFSSTISGADLIVGARSGPVQLLLYSVFRVGSATNNFSWQSYQALAARDEVQWTIPISLGDSHRGYRVMGTSKEYFNLFKFGRQRNLSFQSGVAFDDLFDVVLGAEVAASLGYKMGDKITITHGVGSTGFIEHDDKPFQVVGILDRTGTPVDRTLHVSLEAIEAIHIDWKDGAKVQGMDISASMVRNLILEPKSITAAIVGLNNRVAVFGLQRWVNQYNEEPLLGILPGVALQQLWSIVRIAEKALQIVSVFIIMAAFLGMISVSLAGLNERRREIAILRSVGAGQRQVFVLLVFESFLITLAGLTIGVALLYVMMALSQSLLEQLFGLYMPITLPTVFEWKLLGIFLLAGALCGVIPGWKAYRNSLVDGLTSRL